MTRNRAFNSSHRRMILRCFFLWLIASNIRLHECRCIAAESQGIYIITEEFKSYAKMAAEKWQCYHKRQNIVLCDLVKTNDSSFTAVGKLVARVCQKGVGQFDQWATPNGYSMFFDLFTGSSISKKKLPAGSAFWTYSLGAVGTEQLFLPIEKRIWAHPEASAGIVDISIDPSVIPHFTGTWSYALDALSQNQRHLRAHTVLRSEDKQFGIFGTTELHFQVRPLKFLRVEYEGVIIPATRIKKGFWPHFLPLEEYEKDDWKKNVNPHKSFIILSCCPQIHQKARLWIFQFSCHGHELQAYDARGCVSTKDRSSSQILCSWQHG